MAIEKLPSEIIDAIQAAPRDDKPHVVAERLTEQFGRRVSETSVKKYRREARTHQQEQVRDEISDHQAAATTSALADLTELRTIAKRAFKQGWHPQHGNLWLRTIQVELKLEAAAPAAGEFDGWDDDKLERYAATGDPDGDPDPAGPGAESAGQSGDEAPASGRRDPLLPAGE